MQVVNITQLVLFCVGSDSAHSALIQNYDKSKLGRDSNR